MSEPSADTSIPTGAGYCPACGAWKADLGAHARWCLRPRGELTPEAWSRHVISLALDRLFRLVRLEAIYTVLAPQGVRRDAFPWERRRRDSRRLHELHVSAHMVLSWRDARSISATSGQGEAPLAEVEP